MPLLLFLFFLISIIVAIIIYDIYNSGEHTRYKAEELDVNAKVVDIQRKTVGSKGQRKYRTIVVFSDGFKYISHETDREDHFFMYTISMNPELFQEIIQEAVKKHEEVCAKKLLIVEKKKQQLSTAYDALANNNKNKLGKDELSLMIEDFINRANEFVGNYGMVYSVKFINDNHYYGKLKNGFLVLNPKNKKIHIFKVDQINGCMIDFVPTEELKIYYINCDINEKSLINKSTESTVPVLKDNQSMFDTKIERIQKLNELKKAGVLTDSEYEKLKQEVLNNK